MTPPIAIQANGYLRLIMTLAYTQATGNNDLITKYVRASVPSRRDAYSCTLIV